MGVVERIVLEMPRLTLSRDTSSAWKTPGSALTAAKLVLYRAMRQAGLDEAQPAQRLGWPPKKIAHILDGYHVVRLEQLETALAALGRRLVVTSERA